ncbi:unnamed protein product, partial [Mesorhabditis belari]|uniref:J domain-containing protein n=1 Tax=Mesorhabditis belari TaxID=2138241 RepID=A0AAF3F2B0_9BILA
MTFNPYLVLNLQRDCNEKDIQKAYKVLCLRWHPDKNPDNVELANQKFIEAKKAVDLLLDKEKRTEFDNAAQRKATSEKRQQERREHGDAKRKQMYDDLIRREKEFVERGTHYAPSTTAKESDEKYKAKMRKVHEQQARAETEALRKKWEAEVEEEIRAQKERLSHAQVHHEENDSAPKLKVSWKIANEAEDYDETAMRILFDPYGTIDEVILMKGKKNKRTALIVYSNGGNPWGAETETGAGGSELSCEWIQKPQTGSSTQNDRNKKSNEQQIKKDENFASLSLEEMEAQMFANLAEPEPSTFQDDLLDDPDTKKTKWDDE